MNTMLSIGSWCQRELSQTFVPHIPARQVPCVISAQEKPVIPVSWRPEPRQHCEPRRSVHGVDGVVRPRRFDAGAKDKGSDHGMRLGVDAGGMTDRSELATFTPGGPIPDDSGASANQPLVRTSADSRDRLGHRPSGHASRPIRH